MNKGEKMVTAIGGWMIVKGILNTVLSSFGMDNIITLLVSVALAYAMIKKVPFMHYITGGLLALVVLANLKNNIDGRQFLYLAEAAVDIVCAVLLFTNKDIKEHFGNNGL